MLKHVKHGQSFIWSMWTVAFITNWMLDETKLLWVTWFYTVRTILLWASLVFLHRSDALKTVFFICPRNNSLSGSSEWCLSRDVLVSYLKQSIYFAISYKENVIICFRSFRRPHLFLGRKTEEFACVVYLARWLVKSLSLMFLEPS